ncbi:hypothetical protein [Microbulbifer variabilis]|jgi:PBP1b-binding outer membrane lipoprotein LpoB|uniref:DUF4878 domain-containing protein n=1 Tax=Microbulbifer variabilis TaxID=266805 RepID=A0ABY4VBC1_9GAMM|nr:hypothetical protein [Microbulbifer variabilis]USD20706.1 hypothetical protein MJO52_16760 [Microbulbifer variabilis]
MKKIAVLVLSVIFLASCGENSTPEDLAEDLVDALTSQDQEGYNDLFMTAEDHEGLIELALNADIRESSKKGFMKRTNELVEKMQGADYIRTQKSRIQTAYKKILLKSKNHSFDWDEADLESIDYSIETKFGVERAKLVITMEYMDMKYKINAPRIIKSQDGWKLDLMPSWRG